MTTEAGSSPTVVKVGGSLFDWPDLGPRLRCWLDRQAGRPILLVPGGGASADVVRAWDRLHGLGSETAHWLALRSLTFNAHFLAMLVPGARIVAHGQALAAHEIGVLDAHAFVWGDEGNPACLAHSWDVTSDSVAARCAVVCGARRLVLLKSVEIPAGMSWRQAAQRSLIDGRFEETLRHAKAINVQALCLRTWQA
jgi:aspartokinase-like uncharacterized kinase